MQDDRVDEVKHLDLLDIFLLRSAKHKKHILKLVFFSFFIKVFFFCCRTLLSFSLFVENSWLGLAWLGGWW